MAVVVTQSELETIVRKLWGEKRTIAFTNGCFDVFHAGHAVLLRESALLADVVIVAVNSDDSICRLKGGGRPVNSLAHRLCVLSEIRSADYLVVFDEPTPLELVKRVRPDVLVKGADSPLPIAGAAEVESWGGRVHRVPHFEGLSSSRTIRNLRGVKTFP